MAPFNPTLVVLVLLFLLGLASSAPENREFDFESPWDDLPRWSSDWSPYDVQTAFDRSRQRMMYYRNTPMPTYRTKRDLSSPPSCPSAFARQIHGVDTGAAQSTGSAEKAVVTNQYETSQRSGLEDYGYGYIGPQSYQGVQQHPNLAQFQRIQPANSWIPGNLFANSQQYRSSSSKHPVEALPDVIETPAAQKSASQYAFYSPNGAINNYRAAETQSKPLQPAEDTNNIKTTNGQYYNYGTDYYRQQIQQALADGKQLNTGIPNAALNQQLALAAANGVSAQPVFTTANFPVTSLSFDPEEMRKVYGPYYVPPVFSLVQRQPNGINGANDGVVRDVLQYLLNQYQGNGVNSGFRNQRQYIGSILPDISKEHEKILHGFLPIQKLPRQSAPTLPSFTGDNQLLPPNLYRSDKWEPVTNLVVHEPVNLAEFEQSGVNQMNQYRSTPCSREKRQMDSVWGYYPELAPDGARMAEPMPMYPGLKSNSRQHGLEGSQMGRSAFGLDDPRQSMGYGRPLGFGQPLGAFGQPTGLGLPPGGLSPFGNQPYPDYYSNYQGRDALSGLQQVISGISSFMPLATGNGFPQFRK